MRREIGRGGIGVIGGGTGIEEEDGGDRRRK